MPAGPVLEGGGERIPSGPELSVTPSPITFQNTPNGSGAAMTVTLKNTGGETCNVASITSSDAHFIVSGLVLPTTIARGASKTCVVTFTPDAVAAFAGTLTVTSDAINTPNTVAMSGTGVAAGSVSLSLGPSGLAFPDTKVGVASAELIVRITNVGAVNVTINALAFVAPFSAGATAPGLPQAITPGNFLDFGVKFTPSLEGFASVANGARVTSTAVGSPNDVLCTGTGFLITPAFVLDGSLGAILLAFQGSAGIAVMQADPTNLDCEEAASFKSKYDFGTVMKEEELGRVGFRYEDLGIATVTLKAKGKRKKQDGTVETQTQSVDKVIGTATADEWVWEEWADLIQTNSIIEIEFSRLAAGGPLSITEIFPAVERRGDKVEAT